MFGPGQIFITKVVECENFTLQKFLIKLERIREYCYCPCMHTCNANRHSWGMLVIVNLTFPSVVTVRPNIRLYGGL